ncbi:MAG: 50S ribosomal protein L18 [Nitrospinae bacterium]|nr:50S ribosomal protein L18 [Nitrospinota bacterium]
MEQKRTKSRLARKERIRKKIKGDSERPRLTVYKSLKHIYAQIINDTEGKTVASISTLSKEFKGKMKSAKNLAAAKLLGEIIADKAIQKGIKKLVFDRNGYIYHGKIAAIVDKVREKGVTV